LLPTPPLIVDAPVLAPELVMTPELLTPPERLMPPVLLVLRAIFSAPVLVMAPEMTIAVEAALFTVKLSFKETAALIVEAALPLTWLITAPPPLLSIINEAPPLAARVYPPEAPMLSVPTVADVVSMVTVRALLRANVSPTVEVAPPGTTSPDQLLAVFQLPEELTFQVPFTWARASGAVKNAEIERAIAAAFFREQIFMAGWEAA
jgi:hypothetical protein